MACDKPVERSSSPAGRSFLSGIEFLLGQPVYLRGC
jgi:hypothetical protein